MKEIIRLDNIKRDFHVGDETVHALRGVSFTIREGEFVTIMGTSGSGKSTLLNTLGCLDTPTSGEYYLDGVSVRTMNKRQSDPPESQDRIRFSKLQSVAEDDSGRERRASSHVQSYL
jgi:ABC-type lipoprotein export system ATPase subunit